MGCVPVVCAECQEVLHGNSMEVRVVEYKGNCDKCRQIVSETRSRFFCSEGCMTKHFPRREDMDIQPNPRRLEATADYRHDYNMPGIGKVYYSEYGSGAELVTKRGFVVADFPSHLDAEKFLRALLNAEYQEKP